MGRVDEAVPKKDDPIVGHHHQYDPYFGYRETYLMRALFGVPQNLFVGHYDAYLGPPVREQLYDAYYEPIQLNWGHFDDHIPIVESNGTAPIGTSNRLDDSTRNHLATLIYNIVYNVALNNLRDNDRSTKPGD